MSQEFQITLKEVALGLVQPQAKLVKPAQDLFEICLMFLAYASCNQNVINKICIP